MAGGLVTNKQPEHWTPSRFIQTKCDALAAHPGDITFAVMCELLEKHVFSVTDEAAAKAMQLAWQHLKLTLELSSATTLAAVLSDEFKAVAKEYGLRNVGVVLSGGNVDLDAQMPWKAL